MKYETHPAAGSFPMMSGQRFAELRVDIKANGLMRPIMLCDGMVLDGRNRYKACIELGIEAKTEVFDGDPWSYVWSLNGERRDLVDEQRYLIWKHCSGKSESWKAKKEKIKEKANEARSEATKEQHERSNPRAGESSGSSTECATTKKQTPGQDAKAEASKTNRGAVARGDALATKRPDLAEQVRKGEMKAAEAHRQMKRQEKEEERTAAILAAKKTVRSGEKNYKLIESDIIGLREYIKKDSIDSIVTDPPYKKEYLGTYDALAEFAEYALIPGGSLFVMIGQSYLPEIISQLCCTLQYRWIMAYLTPGGQAVQIWKQKVNTFWKPVLWFTKGDPVECPWKGDVVKSSTNDKRFHQWGQSESGMADLIERCTKPGETILDPFCGAGTTGVSAVRAGRKFIGSDIDAAALKISADRLEEVEIELLQRAE